MKILPLTPILSEDLDNVVFFSIVDFGFIRRGKNKRGKASNMDRTPNITNPSHQAPIHAGCRGEIITSAK